MGFPLSKGTVKDSILTCHWHHARFDLDNGGTFDQWAGDVHSFPVEIRNENEVWVDVSSMLSGDVDSYEMLLRNGLKQNIQLIIAKAVIAIFEQNFSVAVLVPLPSMSIIEEIHSLTIFITQVYYTGDNSV
jgi:hypothetical protein